MRWGWAWGRAWPRKHASRTATSSLRRLARRATATRAAPRPASECHTLQSFFSAWYDFVFPRLICAAEKLPIAVLVARFLRLAGRLLETVCCMRPEVADIIIIITTAELGGTPTETCQWMLLRHCLVPPPLSCCTARHARPRSGRPTVTLFQSRQQSVATLLEKCSMFRGKKNLF